jgi:hypothetical protein
MSKAVFILGGSASGKSAFVRDEYIGTLDTPNAKVYIEPQEVFCVERWFDPDRVKREIPLYTIEMALERGYHVEVVYVYCPLKIALRRAKGRKRKLAPLSRLLLRNKMGSKSNLNNRIGDGYGMLSKGAEDS